MNAPADNASAVFPELREIQQIQLEKLGALVQAILPRNRFYQQKYAGLAARLSFVDLEGFFRWVPFTSKQEVAKDLVSNPPYGTNLTYPIQAYVRCHQTSGSTATPIRWLDTPASWDHIVDNWVQILGVAGARPEDRFFFAFSFGPFLGFWSAMEAALRRGCFCFPGGAMSSVARLQAVLDHQITVLCCTPTYAQRLGEVAREQNLDLHRSRVRLIIVAGEAGGSIPATRARIESLWPGASVFDHHGMTEVGPVTFQCPACPGVLHVLESAYLPEVIDPNTRAAVLPGERGELVLTTLDRTGSPLLRYRTGDLVQPRPRGACACGRHELAFEGGILGRNDDMVVVRGVNVYPSLIEEIIRHHQDIAEYRVNLDCRGAMAELSLEVEPLAEKADPESLQRRLEQSLHTALNLRVLVSLRLPGSLPRFEMKAKRWVRINA
jgi:phenylacetate-CoA ligase